MARSAVMIFYALNKGEVIHRPVGLLADCVLIDLYEHGRINSTNPQRQSIVLSLNRYVDSSYPKSSTVSCQTCHPRACSGFKFFGGALVASCSFIFSRHKHARRRVVPNQNQSRRKWTRKITIPINGWHLHQTRLKRRRLIMQPSTTSRIVSIREPHNSFNRLDF